MRRLQISSRKYLSSNFLGNFRASFHGHGIEFRDFREYQPDDDAKYIDWSASSKQGVTMIRRYQEERQGTLELILDVSQSLFYEKNTPKYKVMRELMEIFGDASYSSGLSLGGYILHNNGEMYIKARHSPLQKYYFLKKYAFTPRKKAPLDVEFLLKTKKQKKIFVIISDSLEIDRKSLSVLAKLHDVIYLHISSHFENSLEGDELIELFGSERNYAINLADNTKKHIYQQRRQEKLTAFEMLCKSLGISTAFFDENCNIYSVLLRLMRTRTQSHV